MTNDQTISLLVQELSEQEVTEEEIRAAFDEYVNLGMMSPEKAKGLVLKKYGAKAPEGKTNKGWQSETVSTFENDVDNAVIPEAIILTRTERNTDKGTMYLGDLSAFGESVRYAALRGDWPDAGAKISIDGCKISDFRGTRSLTVFAKNKVDVLEAKVALEVPDVACSDIKQGRGLVTVKGKVIEARTITKQDGGEFWVGTIADETGPVNYTSYDSNPNLSEGDEVTLRQVMAGDYRGSPTVYFTDTTKVEQGALNLESVVSHQGIDLGQAQEGATINNAMAEGIVLEVRDGSGIISRCPEDKRLLDKGECNVHGRVKGVPDLRTKLVLDDEKGSVDAYLNRECTEKVLGYNLEKARELAMDAGDNSVITAELEEKLTAQYVRLTGNLTQNNFGPTLLVQDIELVAPDAEALLAEATELRQTLSFEEVSA